MAITGIKSRIETERIDETIRFYQDVIGLKVHEHWEGDDPGAIMGIDDIKSDGFLEVASSPKTAKGSGLSLQFRTDDVDGFVSKIEGSWEFRGPERRPWGSTYVYLRDPNGIQVIVYEGMV